MNATSNIPSVITAAFVAIFTLSACPLLAQSATNWSFKTQIEENDYYLFEGTINERYPIKMYLEIGWDFCGEGNVNRWKARSLHGWYAYQNVGTKIPLLGSIMFADPDPFVRLYVPPTLQAESDAITCEVKNYREVFTTSNSYQFTDLLWQTKDMDEPYKVELETIHDFSWNTTTRIGFTWRGVELASLNLTERSGVPYIQWADVTAAKEINNEYYAIIEFGHVSNPGSTGSGYCGAGEENFLAFLKLNDQMEWETFEFHQVESCHKNLPEGTYSYDADFPERGIRVRK